MNKKLADLTEKDIAAMSYDDIMAARRVAYADHVAKMTIPSEIDEWARKMEFQNLNSGGYEDWCDRKEMVPSDDDKTSWCKTLGIHWNRLPLIDAFLVLRYGEEPRKHWPTEFSAGDIQRAENWFTRPKANEGINHALANGV